MNDLAEKKFSRFASLKLRRLSLRRPASSVADSQAPGMVAQRRAHDRSSTSVTPILIALPTAIHH